MRLSTRGQALPEVLARGTLAIEVIGATCVIGDRTLLADVDLSVRAGEVLALIGPNGAGKSTLLAAISGDRALRSGEVRIAGKRLHEWTLRELSRRRAVLPQENGVFFPFTVEQVVEMGRRPWQRTEREDEDTEAVADALRSTDIERFVERRVPTLSGGERARTALARVLAQRTGILLLDEPTAALDLKHQEAVLRLAAERADRGDAVIVVLHDLNLAAAYADTIAMLSQGRIVACGTPAEVLTAEQIGRVYEHPVEVFQHPTTGAPMIVPVREIRMSSREEGTP